MCIFVYMPLNFLLNKSEEFKWHHPQTPNLRACSNDSRSIVIIQLILVNLCFKNKNIKCFSRNKKNKSLPDCNSIAAKFQLKEKCRASRLAYKVACCECAFKIQ